MDDVVRAKDLTAAGGGSPLARKARTLPLRAKGPRRCLLIVGLFALTTPCLPGCSGRFDRHDYVSSQSATDYYRQAALGIEFPDAVSTGHFDTASTAAPMMIGDDPPEYWDVTLQEAIKIALSESEVLRDLGGQVLQSPSTIRTIHGPAIQETDPRFGVDAALSAFDATFSTSGFFENNDRALNNSFFGGGTRQLKQDVSVFQTQFTKLAATGTRFILRHNTDYDANNAPGNTFASAWNTNIEAEFRQPLLQGAGVQFNRIAGPSGGPGSFAGVLIARINADVSLADFEIGVRDLVSNVENAYWDLYFAYRDLEAKISARDSSLELWRRIHAMYQAGRRGGEAEKEAQAREQYFRFQEEVENALTGRLLEGTRNRNGSVGGTFRANGGIHVAERRLRLIAGLPISDGRLIRPIDEPVVAPVAFDWQEILGEALLRRAELRRQKWQVKRRELEIAASRNFLRPRLDIVGRYRAQGFGKDLLDPDSDRKPRFDNAYQNLTDGDFQDWQFGFEFTAPIGFRREHAALRNAQLALARERAILVEQERQVVHDLSNTIADVSRAYAVVQTSLNRRIAAKQQVQAVQAAYEADQAPLDLVLDAQRRLADAESRHYRALVEHALAIKNVHFDKGSLLDLNGVFLAEGPWPGKAYDDAARREERRGPPRRLSYIFDRPTIVSRGPVPQLMLSSPGMETEEVIWPFPETPQPPSPANDPLTPDEALPHPASGGPHTLPAAVGG